MSDKPRPAARHGWLVSGGLGLLFALLYVLTRSEFHVPDALAYARLTRDSALLAPTFFQGEHLLYPFAGWIWLQMLQAFGYAGGAIQPMQWLNAIAGGAGVGLVAVWARVASRGRASWTACAVAGAASGLAYAWWLHSTQAENQIIAIAFGIAGLVAAFSVGESPEKDNDRSLAAAVFLAVALLVHGTLVLAIPIAFLAIVWGARRWAPVALFVAVLGGLTLLVYGVVGFLILGLTPQQLPGWFAPGGAGVWGQFGIGSLVRAPQTLAGSLLFLGEGPNFRQLLSSPADLHNSLRIIAFGAIAVGLAGAVLHAVVRFRGRSEWRPAVLLILLATLTLGFATWWAPDDVQFWILGLTALIVLCLLVQQDIRSYRGLGRLAGPLALTVVAAIGLLNLAVVFAPQTNAAANPQLAAARCLALRLQADDLVIAPGWGWAGSYLPYLSQVRTFSLLDSFLTESGRDRARLFGQLDREIQAALARGGTVYVTELYDMTPQDRDYFSRAMGGLSPEQIDLPRTPALECAGQPVYRVTVERSA